MKQLAFLSVLCASLALFSACGQNGADAPASGTNAQPEQPAEDSAEAQPAEPEEPAEPAPNTNEVAVIKTNFGDMVIEFWPDVAPNTVANFKKLAEEGFYNGTAFHRIIDGFMIQGGDPYSKDPGKTEVWGTGDPGYKIDAEFNDRPHVRGVISMARGPDPDSAGSQFFICLAPVPQLDNQYTAFGKLIRGDDVLGKIGAIPVKQNLRGEASLPTQRAHVESIRIVPFNSLENSEEKSAAARRAAQPLASL